MNTLTFPQPCAPTGAAAAMRRVVAGLHWLRIAYAERRRAARARGELARLDAEALRDIGMTASEIDSYIAEASGMAPRTRPRWVDDLSGRRPR